MKRIKKYLEKSSNHNSNLIPVKGTDKEGRLDRKSLKLQHSSKKCSARSKGNLVPKLPFRTVLHLRNESESRSVVSESLCTVHGILQPEYWNG